MNPTLLEQLHDIEGLDPISAWPLAIGWWIVIVGGIFILGALFCAAAYRIAFIRSWKNDALLKLSILEKNLSDANARGSVMVLSEYLRRIALRRFSRKECAGLSGEAWLRWLAMHDPKKFDWESKGTLLIEVPYAPVSERLSVNQVKDLIRSVRNWVR